MIYFLYGSDTFRIQKKVHEITAEYKKVHTSGFNFIRFDARETPFEDFKRAAGTVSMFDEKKLIQLEGLFETPRFRDAFLTYLNDFHLDISKDIIVLIVEGGLDVKKHSARIKALRRVSRTTQEFEVLKGVALKKWFEKEAAAKGVRFGPGAKEKLLASTEADLWRLENELEKLRAYAGGSLIQEETIRDLVRPKLDPAIFATVDAIAGRNIREALKQIHEHLETGDSPLYLLSMITYQIRNIVLVKDLEERSQGGSSSSRFGSLGLHPFVIQKSLSQARRFTMKELKEIYERLLETDIDIKQGRKDPRLALELLITSLEK